MSELFGWMQDQWYQLVSALVQLGILATLFFMGRKALGLIGASKAQGEARQELETSYSLTGRSIATNPAEERRWQLGSAIARGGRGVARWLQSPMGSGVGPVRRIVRWLQAPAGS